LGFQHFQINKSAAIDIGIILKGPNLDKVDSKENIPLAGFQVSVVSDKDFKGPSVKITDKVLGVTDANGFFSFKGEQGRIYYLVFIPPTSLVHLYQTKDFVYTLDTQNIPETDEFNIEITLLLTEEAKRDFKRRNDLLVYEKALQQYFEWYHQYPQAIAAPLEKDSFVYQRLSSPFKKISSDIFEGDNYFDPLPSRSYRYFSDGTNYLIIAYPEVDFRPELPNLSIDTLGKKIYYLGNLSLLTLIK